ncbi:hypothetical protein CWI37_0653p0030 [Hamiltosporidium tvaerminnensis]|uniref:Uncharacterized protein n=1 Tax=Hamiltosporidium tvaerminnensis TaxID=1176355 RepID=A0A4Q9L2L0_9MICR|nr:hypothetical protein CWI37_0653p0030 [Hamiltosporidium tvaerminnensis]
MLIFLFIPGFLFIKFRLKRLNHPEYIGVYEKTPGLVKKKDALHFHLEKQGTHKVGLCSSAGCLTEKNSAAIFGPNGTAVLMIRNDDGTVTFMLNDKCLAADRTGLAFLKCGEYDKFEKITDKLLRIKGNNHTKSDELHHRKIEKEHISNPSETNHHHHHHHHSNMSENPELIERTEKEHLKHLGKHKSDPNYTTDQDTARHHNSHVHLVGETSNRAFYTFYSYHPSDRHSTWAFHAYHHGIPLRWADEKTRVT